MVDTRTKLKKYGDDQATKKVEMHISAERLHQQEQVMSTVTNSVHTMITLIADVYHLGAGREACARSQHRGRADRGEPLLHYSPSMYFRTEARRDHLSISAHFCHYWLASISERLQGNRCARAGDYAGAQKLLNMAYDGVMIFTQQAMFPLIASH